jgi:hypothetical protein
MTGELSMAFAQVRGLRGLPEKMWQLNLVKFVLMQTADDVGRVKDTDGDVMVDSTEWK